MKIDLVKIGKIKNLKDLKKFELDKPVFLNNYLFHYLILTNNLKGLKLTKFPVQVENDDKLNGFHIASKYNYYDILKYLINKYPKYVNSRNSDNETFLHYLDVTNDNYTSLINDKMIPYFQIYSNDKLAPLEILFTEGTHKNILSIIKKYNLKYYNYNESPYHFGLVINKNLNNKQKKDILKELHKKDNKIFSYTDDDGNNLLYSLILEDNIELFKYLYNLKEQSLKFDAYSPINTYHIFSVAYSKSLINNNFKLTNFILDNILKDHNFNETNKNGDNLAHFIVKSRILRNSGNYDIEKAILSKYDLWDRINVDNKTVLDYIVNLDYDKYSKFVKNAQVNKNFKIKKIKNKKWKKLIDNLKRYSNNDKDIKIQKNKYAHGNLFQARFTDIAIFSYYLDDKYKNLYLPRSKKESNLQIKKGLKYPDDLLKYYTNFVWTIIWNDKDNYLIHPSLNGVIKKNKDKYDYSFCLLSLRLPSGGLHASLIFYDFKKNIIERFDPYGNTMDLDKNMDSILEKELTKGNNLKYYPPNKYFPVAGFQTLSDENNMNNQKMGDFGGYCLAWCIWYIEHRIANKEIEPKHLIRKTLHKLMEMKMKPNEYIRNYANHINKKRVSKLIKYGVPKNYTSNENLEFNHLKKIKLAIIEENQK